MWESSKVKELRVKLRLRDEEVRQYQRQAERWERKYTNLRNRVREALMESIGEQIKDVSEMTNTVAEVARQMMDGTKPHGLTPGEAQTPSYVVEAWKQTIENGKTNRSTPPKEE